MIVLNQEKHGNYFTLVPKNSEIDMVKPANALANSVNTISVRIVDLVGLGYNFHRKWGSSPDEQQPPHCTSTPDTCLKWVERDKTLQPRYLCKTTRLQELR